MPNPEQRPKPKVSFHAEPIAKTLFPFGGTQPSKSGNVQEPPLPDKVRRHEDAIYGTRNPPKSELPSWFLDLAKRRADPSEAVKAILDHLPTTDLLQAKLMINEIGRIQGAGEVISRMVTQETVGHLRGRG